MKVHVLAPGENWIVDRMVHEWNYGNRDISTLDPHEADVVWLLGDWAWHRVARLLPGRKVLTTVHHIVPEKFGHNERVDFDLRDFVTTAYHVFNQRTMDVISLMTKKPIHLVPYWANQVLWQPTGSRDELRKRHKLPPDAFLVGSFQRDTEGAGIDRGVFLPKLEKGPDLLCDHICRLRSQRDDVHVILSGWRRQYVMGRLDAAGIPYTYFELPSQNVVNELYQVLDVYVVAARHEGGPQALIECGLTSTPVVSTPVGIAEQVLPSSAINDDLSLAVPAVPDVSGWRLPGGFEPYRRLLQGL